MTDKGIPDFEPKTWSGSMLRGHLIRNGSYCGWCRKELPDPGLYREQRYCDDQCRKEREQDRNDRTGVTRGELAAELKEVKDRLEALERHLEDKQLRP